MSNGHTPNGRDLDDFQAFPILTTQTSHVETTGSSTGGTPSAGRLAEHALRDILAIRPASADAESIVAALNNAFSSTVVDGRVTWKWTPRSYTVQADMGEVTGAQASIYTRAKTMLDQSVLLLDTLNALRADADDEDIDATRSTVRTYLLELIDELGTSGGPRVQRVDTIFEALLGPALDPQTSQPVVDPEKISGLLGIVRDRLGLTRPRVNTIAEEQTLTNFLVLAEHVIALRLSWEAQRPFFSGTGDVFLGTQLVLLGRALGVVAESVHEAEFTMDSVFLGPAERQTIPLPFPIESGETPLKIAELLEWIGHFASEEGPRIIREAGKDGVIALVPTLERLHKLTDLTQEIAESDSDNPTPGFHTPRVRRALSELVEHLDEARTLARQVRRTPGPEAIEIEPTSAPNDETLRLEVFGRFFQPGATIRLELSVVSAPPVTARRRVLTAIGGNGSSSSNGNGASTVPPIEATRTRFVSDGLLVASFDLSSAPPESTWSVVVANPDYAEHILPDAFTVEAADADTPGPIVTEIDPPLAPNDDSLRLDVFGEAFQPGATVRLEPADDNTVASIAAIRTRFVSEGMLVATFDLSAAPLASVWHVAVTNPDAAEFLLLDAFTVEGDEIPAPSQPPIPPTQPPPSPAPVPRSRSLGQELLRPLALYFHDIDGNMAGVVEFSRAKPPKFSEKQHIGIVRIMFSRSLHDDLIAATPFQVDVDHRWSGLVVQQSGADIPVPGTIRVDPDNRSVLEFAVSGDDWLKKGSYSVMLSSEDDTEHGLPALSDHDGAAIDGGQVECKFIITAD